MPQLLRRRSSRKHRDKKVRPEQKQTGQSLIGTLALGLSLVGLFLMLLQLILKLQASQGMLEVYRSMKPWLVRGEALSLMAALFTALVSFPFSSKNQRNAVIAILVSCTLLGSWAALNTDWAR
ncbi:MAG: hypothetical protein JNM56_23975 [Planctomycetia bacterium]|nr:hypothetical protein [Planctomycetia bacterium]